MTSLLTVCLGAGPAAVVTAGVPDRHHFRGSYGGKDVIPLWRDSEGTQPNVTAGLLGCLSAAYGRAVTPQDLFAYVYAVLSTPSYVERFSDELRNPGPRVPITKNGDLFGRAAGLGRLLVWLHTYGERFVPEAERAGRVPQGSARCQKGIPGNRYPEEFSYSETERVLRVGEGEFGPVAPSVMEFSVSGYPVVESWLKYRMKEGHGKKSSPLDDIRPTQWTGAMTEELLRLLWIVEATLAEFPALRSVLDDIVAGDVFTEAELPRPTEDERRAPSGDEQEAPQQPDLL